MDIQCAYFQDIYRSAFEGFLFDFFTKKYTVQEKEADFFLSHIIPIVVAISPHSPYVPLFCGELYRIQGLYKKALLEFETIELESISPTSPIRSYILTSKAFTAFWKDQQPSAKQLLNQSYKINPTYTPTLLCGYEVCKADKKEEAYACITAALANDPDNYQAKMCEIEAQFYGIGREENKVEAENRLLQLIQKTQSALASHMKVQLAKWYEEQNKSAKAIEVLNTICRRADLKDIFVRAKDYIMLAKAHLLQPPHAIKQIYETLRIASSTVVELSDSLHQAEIQEPCTRKDMEYVRFLFQEAKKSSSNDPLVELGIFMNQPTPEDLHRIFERDPTNLFMAQTAACIFFMENRHPQGCLEVLEKQLVRLKELYPADTSIVPSLAQVKYCMDCDRQMEDL